METTQPSSKLSFDVFASRCPSRKAFDQIFSRWGMLVLARLSSGNMRFGHLRRAVDGISERMLSKTLKVLEEERLIYREEWEEKLPHVEYGLTDRGKRISAGIVSVIDVLYSELEQPEP